MRNLLGKPTLGALAAVALVATSLSAPAVAARVDTFASELVTATDGRQYQVGADGRLTLAAVDAATAERHAQRVDQRQNDYADLDGDKIVDRLEAAAAEAGSGRIDVVATSGRSAKELAALLRVRFGAQVRHTYEAINAVAASLPAAALPKLAAVAWLRNVAPDDPVSVPEPPGPEPAGKETMRPYNPVTAAQAVPGFATWRGGYDGSGIDVAVVDTGVDARHADLKGRVVFGGNFVTGSSCPAVPSDRAVDPYGHGTHVAGIIAGAGDTGGLAPKARIVSLRVLDCNGQGQTSDIDAALQWLIDHHDDQALGLNIKVVNLSLGSNYQSSGQDSNSLLLNKLVAEGVAVFVAAGNSGEYGLNTVGTPGVARYVTTVGAVAGLGAAGINLAYFSSRGPVPSGANKPELTAPGVDILSAQALTSDFSAGASVSGTLAMSGTSMATPWVAGLAALALQKNPALAPSGTVCDCVDGATNITDPLKALLTSTADDHAAAGWDTAFGYGVVEPGLALGTTASSAYPASSSATGAFSPLVGSQRFAITHAGGPLALSIEPQVATSEYAKVRVKGVELYSQSGDEIPLDTSRFFFYLGPTLYTQYLPAFYSLQRTSAFDLPAGKYLLDVRLANLSGNAVVDASGATAIQNVSNLLTLSLSSDFARPGSTTTATFALANTASAAATVSVTTGAADLSANSSSFTLQPGTSKQVVLTAALGSTLSGTWVRGTVTATTDSRLAGYRTNSRTVVIADGLPGSGAKLERVSIKPGEVDSAGDASFGFSAKQKVLPTKSGSLVFFASSDALVAGLTSGKTHVYVKDRSAGTLALLSATAEAGGGMGLFDATPDGKRVLISTDTALVAADNDASSDLYVIDWPTGAATLVTVGASGAQVDVNYGAAGLKWGIEDYWSAALSNDGNRVVFKSIAPFTSGDTLFETVGYVSDDAFVRDLTAATTTRVSADPGQTQMLSGWYSTNVDATGRFVSYARMVEAPADSTDWDVMAGTTKMYMTLELADLESGQTAVRLAGGTSRIDWISYVAFGQSGRLYWSGQADSFTATSRLVMFNYDARTANRQTVELPAQLLYDIAAVDEAAGLMTVQAQSRTYYALGNLTLDGRTLSTFPAESGERLRGMAIPSATSFGWVGANSVQALVNTDDNYLSDQYVLNAAAATGPSVTALSSTSPTGGSTLTITGKNLSDVTAVSVISGQSRWDAPIASKTATEVKVTVWSGMNGRLEVFSPNGWGWSSASIVTGNAPAPVISGFTPARATYGATLTISGSNFSGASIVTIAGSEASFTVVSDSRIDATVPNGVSAGQVSVTTYSGIDYSDSDFTPILLPIISQIGPDFVEAGQDLTVRGSNFLDITKVKVGGQVTTFSIVSSAELTARVPAGAADLVVEVTNAAGTVGFLGGNRLCSVLSASAVSPTTAAAGDTIAVTGTGFGCVDSVTIGGSAVSFAVASDSRLTFSLPQGSSGGRVQLSSQAGKSVVAGTVAVAGMKVSDLEYTGPTTVTAGSAFNLTFKLSSEGAALAGREVLFDFNRGTFSATTNANGVATLPVSGLISGSYPVTGRWAGDGEHLAAEASGSVRVGPAAKVVTKLALTSAKTFKGSSKPKLTVTLKTAAGKAIAGKSVKFTFNGKTVQATTNSSGVASTVMAMPKKAGTYKLALAFAATGQYLGSTLALKLKVT